MAHNPNINLFEQYCPCGCNKDFAYTSATTDPETHECPNTENEWSKWWACSDSWEEPNLLCVSHSIVWLAVEQYKIFATLNAQVERILVH